MENKYIIKSLKLFNEKAEKLKETLVGEGYIVDIISDDENLILKPKNTLIIRAKPLEPNTTINITVYYLEN